MSLPNQDDTAQKNIAGKFVVIEKLGGGGMGVVYRCLHRYMGNELAVKTIQILADNKDPQSRKSIELFIKEARLAGRLKHPNIVTIYDMGQSFNSFYIAMEYIKGKSLRQLITPGKPFELEQIKALMNQACSAMIHAHDKGVIHCDIKPENILVEEDGKVTIVDFGIATEAAAEATMTSTLIATPCYVAPERLSTHGSLSVQSDIFSLGAVLYELLTGVRAFPGDTPSQVLSGIFRCQPVSPRRINTALPKGADAIIERALAREPSNRYRSCAEFNADIQSLNCVSPPPKRSKPLRETNKVSRTLLLSIMLLVTASILSAAFILQLSGESPGKISSYTSYLKNDLITDIRSLFTGANSSSAPSAEGDKKSQDKVLLVKAAELLEQNHPQRAQKLVQGFLASTPENMEALSILGKTLELQGKQGQALAAYKKITLLEPVDGMSFWYIAGAHESLGESDKALNAYQEFLKSPQSPAFKEEAQKKIELLTTQEAAQNRQALVQDEIDSLFLVARQHLKDRQFEAALQQLDIARQIAPEGIELLALQEAIEREMARAVAEDADNAYRKGIQLFNQNNYAKALEAFDESLQANPSHGEAAQYRARTLEQVEAESQLKSRYDQAVSAARSGDLNRAKTAFDQVLKLSPGHAQAMQWRQRVETTDEHTQNAFRLFEEGLLTKALEEVDEALGLMPNYDKAQKLKKRIEDSKQLSYLRDGQLKEIDDALAEENLHRAQELLLQFEKQFPGSNQAKQRRELLENNRLKSLDKIGQEMMGQEAQVWF